MKTFLVAFLDGDVIRYFSTVQAKTKESAIIKASAFVGVDVEKIDGIEARPYI